MVYQAKTVFTYKLGKMDYIHDYATLPCGSPTKTSGIQSNQAVVGCSRAYLRMDRFISLLILSTCPLASGKPLDTNLKSNP